MTYNLDPLKSFRRRWNAVHHDSILVILAYPLIVINAWGGIGSHGLTAWVQSIGGLGVAIALILTGLYDRIRILSAQVHEINVIKACMFEDGEGNLDMQAIQRIRATLGSAA